jgi:hypothetical protein
LNKNKNSKQKKKKEKEERKKRRKTGKKFADQHGPGPNVSGCVGGTRRGANSTANGWQIGTPNI